VLFSLERNTTILLIPAKYKDKYQKLQRDNSQNIDENFVEANLAMEKAYAANDAGQVMVAIAHWIIVRIIILLKWSSHLLRLPVL
jgi:hypothetical protein